MQDQYKGVFLPLDDRILDHYKGYVLDGKMRSDLTKKNVFSEKKVYDFDENNSKAEKIFKIVFIVLLIPFLVIGAIIAQLFKKFDQFTSNTDTLIERFLGFIFRWERKERIISKKRLEYEAVENEDIIDFLAHCKNHGSKIFIYGYRDLTDSERQKVAILKEKKLVDQFIPISRLIKLESVIQSDNISLHNSLIVVKDVSEIRDAELLGFPTDYKKDRVAIWGRRISGYKGEYCEFVWNCRETLVEIKRNVTYYLEAKNSLFFTNEIVIFIEDSEDQVLNNYISDNLISISDRLSNKNFKFLYFPALTESEFLADKLCEILRYRIPILYSFTDEEFQAYIIAFIQNIKPTTFYQLLVEELGLPFFKKPALLRRIDGQGIADTSNRFTYTPIEYSNIESLNIFFDLYINQIKVPNDREGIYFQFRKAEEPKEYDADWFFSKDSQIDDEIKNRVDSLRTEGKYDIIAEALMYMLTSLKDGSPELLNKVKPLIEKRKLLQTNVVLSPLYIDKSKRIYLSDFGNKEVVLFSLAKTVYLFFLKHPEGVRIKELYEHKNELLNIYKGLTNKSENDDIEKAIDDLVDATKPNINQQCARIRGAFRSIMGEHVAKYYYIDGNRGEPKRIAIANNLVDIRYL